MMQMNSCEIDDDSNSKHDTLDPELTVVAGQAFCRRVGCVNKTLRGIVTMSRAMMSTPFSR